MNQASIGDTRRHVAQIEAMIANFGKTILELEGWIETERSRIHYESTLANSLIQRRDTLKRSIEELKRKLAEIQSFYPMIGATERGHAISHQEA
jgi:hypothetical protein